MWADPDRKIALPLPEEGSVQKEVLVPCNQWQDAWEWHQGRLRLDIRKLFFTETFLYHEGGQTLE